MFVLIYRLTLATTAKVEKVFFFLARLCFLFLGLFRCSSWNVLFSLFFLTEEGQLLMGRIKCRNEIVFFETVRSLLYRTSCKLGVHSEGGWGGWKISFLFRYFLFLKMVITFIVVHCKIETKIFKIDICCSISQF